MSIGMDEVDGLKQSLSDIAAVVDRMRRDVTSLVDVSHRYRDTMDRQATRIAGLEGQVKVNEDDIESLKESLEGAHGRIEKLGQRQPVVNNTIMREPPNLPDAICDPRDGACFSTAFAFAAARWCAAESMDFANGEQMRLELPVWHKYRKADQPANATEGGWVVVAKHEGEADIYWGFLRGMPTWLIDPSQALRFARKEDAESMAAGSLRNLNGNTLDFEFMEFDE